MSPCEERHRHMRLRLLDKKLVGNTPNARTTRYLWAMTTKDVGWASRSNGQALAHAVWAFATAQSQRRLFGNHSPQERTLSTSCWHLQPQSTTAGMDR